MFRLDWASADLEGKTTLTDGASAVGVTVATPLSADCDVWAFGAFPGDHCALYSSNVSEETRLEMTFDAPVTDICFELYDVDSCGDWDDRVTVLARDAQGNLVEVQFGNTASHHQINGNTIDADGAASPDIEGPGAPDSVTVSIAGPIVSLVIIHDNGDDADIAGTVGLSDLTIGGLAATPDGIVEGTNGGDLIDAFFTGDPHGDIVDGGDAIDPNAGPNDDVIEAGGGDDTILAGQGNDTVFAGADDDLVDGGAGADVIDGENGDDTLAGGAGNDTLLGGQGDDRITDTQGSERVDGGQGDDVIEVGILGTPDRGYPGLFGADSNPGDDRDTVDGGAGNDRISTGDDNDSIDGGSGNDTISAGFDDDRVNAGSGNDSVIGGEGADTIFGGSGNDTLFGGLGAPDDPLNVPDDGSGPFGADLVTDNGTDLIDGGAGNDRIFGEDDDDTLIGGTGNDTLDGGIDDDSLSGDAGRDLLLGGQGDDTLEGGADNDTLDGGDGDDDLSGGDGNDRLLGGAGDDSLQGGDGDDTLIGGDGDDTLQGGDGDDLFELGDNDGGRDLAIGGDDADTFRVAMAGDEAVIGGEGGDDFDTLDLRGAGPLRVNFSNNDPATESGTVDFFDGNGNVTDTLTFAEIEQVIPCFTPGSVVATTKGEVYVEDLKPGDKVLTRDNGAQTVEWVGHKLVSGTQMAAMPTMRPILIKAGSLGENLPRQDMLVSPNHRMLISSDESQLYFDEREVLVAAKHLVDGRGIMRAGVEGVTYIHFMCARHEVVLADGAWTESFQPGDNSLAGLDRDQRNEILTLFPDLASREGQGEYVAARKALKKHEALLLTI